MFWSGQWVAEEHPEFPGFVFCVRSLSVLYRPLISHPVFADQCSKCEHPAITKFASDLTLVQTLGSVCTSHVRELSPPHCRAHSLTVNKFTSEQSTHTHTHKHTPLTRNPVTLLNTAVLRGPVWLSAFSTINLSDLCQSRATLRLISVTSTEEQMHTEQGYKHPPTPL